MRRGLYLVHLYTGLTIGLFIVFIGLTGALIVFQPEIDQLLNPELYRVDLSAEPVSLDALVEAAYATYPRLEAGHRPVFSFLRPPQASGGTASMLIKDSFAEDGGPWWEARLDPGTGNVLGARNPEDTIVGFLMGLHIHLLGGEHGIGETLVGLGGIVLLLFCITGAILWWPGRRRLPHGFRVRWRGETHQVNRDLHNVTGIILLLPLLLLALTGIMLVFPQYTKGPLVSLLNISPPPEAPRSQPASVNAVPLPLDMIMQRSMRAFPEAEVTSLTLAGGPDASHEVRKRFPGDPAQRYSEGKAVVWIDQYSGAVLRQEDSRNTPPGTRVFFEWLLPTHTGEIAGMPGRITAMLAGLTPLMLYATGFIVWLRRRRLRYH